MKRKVSIMLAGMVFAVGFAVGCGEKGQTPDKEIFVYMPDGAPALALAQMMAEDTPNDGVTYKVADASKIASKVTYKEEAQNADMCVMPVNLASKHLGDGENYTMLGAVTHGNLYLISKDKDTMYALNNLSALLGKTVGVLQLNEVPGLIFKTVLHKAGVAYQENGASADAVNLVPITGAQDVGAMDGVDLFLLAEPAATMQMDKDFYIVGDVQEMYGDEHGYPQAVLVAKRSVIEKHWNKVENILNGLEDALVWNFSSTIMPPTENYPYGLKMVLNHLEDDTYQSSWYTIMNSTKNHKWRLYQTEMIQRCNAWYQSSADSAADVKAFITAAQAVNSKMATMPSDAFFYGI